MADPPRRTTAQLAEQLDALEKTVKSLDLRVTENTMSHTELLHVRKYFGLLSRGSACFQTGAGEGGAGAGMVCSCAGMVCSCAGMVCSCMVCSCMVCSCTACGFGSSPGMASGFAFPGIACACGFAAMPGIPRVAAPENQKDDAAEGDATQAGDIVQLP
jgi:hypothetical protein